MCLKKSPAEQKIFDKYKNWLSYEGEIPQHIIENYKLEISKL